MPDTPNSLDRQPDPDAKQTDGTPQRGPASATESDAHDPDPRTRLGQLQEGIDDSPVVSTVTPADDPEDDHSDSAPDAV